VIHFLSAVFSLLPGMLVGMLIADVLYDLVWWCYWPPGKATIRRIYVVGSVTGVTILVLTFAFRWPTLVEGFGFGLVLREFGLRRVIRWCWSRRTSRPSEAAEPTRQDGQ
jgi:hypothetical protein